MKLSKLLFTNSAYKYFYGRRLRYDKLPILMMSASVVRQYINNRNIPKDKANSISK